MDHTASLDERERTLLIIDGKRLRRAGVVSLMTLWAKAMGVEIREVTPTVQSGGLEVTTVPDIVVLNVGSVPLSDPESQAWMTSIPQVCSRASLVIISDREDREEVLAAFRAGARGFIPTSLEPSVALQAFTFILEGGSFFPSTALLAIEHGSETKVEGFHRDARPTLATVGPSDLTLRQHEVLGLLRLGRSNKVIARELAMCEATVKVHVRQIMRKLGASNRTQAALRAVQIATGAPPSAEAPSGLEHRVNGYSPVESPQQNGADGAVRRPPVDHARAVQVPVPSGLGIVA